MKAFKDFIKPLDPSQGSVKIKILVIFFSSYGIEIGSERLKKLGHTFFIWMNDESI